MSNTTPLLLSILVASSAGTAAAAEDAPRSPITIHHHSDAGSSFLARGRHAWSDVIISESGRVDVTWRVRNSVALNGYCFRAAYFFRDAAGNVLASRDAGQMCVDGTHVPFAGPSRRQRHLTFQLEPDVMARVRDVVVAHGPGSRNPGALLQGALARAAGIVEVAAPLVQVIGG